MPPPLAPQESPSEKAADKPLTGILHDVQLRLSEQPKYKDIINLGLGNPGREVEPKLLALLDGKQKSPYGSSVGSLETRKAMADFLTEVRYTPCHFDAEYSQIALTRGATAGIQSYLMGLRMRPDQSSLHVLLPTPAYAWYKAVIDNVPDARSSNIDTGGNGWKLTAAALKQALAEHPDADAIILNYPCNPTGKNLTEQEWKSLAAVLEEHARSHKNFRIILDNAYYDLQFGQPTGLLLVASDQLKQHIIEFNSVAKYQAVAGKGGFGFAASENTGDIAILRKQLNPDLGYGDFEPFLREAFHPKYFSPEKLEQAQGFYRRRCTFVANYINEVLGRTGDNHEVALMPEGGVFVFADFGRWIGKFVPDADKLRTTLSSTAPEYKGLFDRELFQDGRINNDTDLSFYLLLKAHVVTIPGKDFGTEPQQGMLRLAVGDIGDLTHYGKPVEGENFKRYLPSKKAEYPLDDLRKFKEAIDRSVRALGKLKEHDPRLEKH